ncbi:hypothetical protein OAO38_00645, partial [Candidatus Pelagibacter ubique]|nr:hypothetical protein [Candidatus Pelagibacter ubique]
FPTSGSVQIGSEYVSYTGKSGNTLTGLSRGVRQTGTIPNNITSTFIGKITLNSQNTQAGFWGGYVQIGGGEVVKIDYSASFNDFDNNTINITARGQRGTTAESHSAGDTVRNHDMRARAWPAGTKVWEGPTHSIPVVQAENTTTNTFERVRLKRRVTLNLSTAAVCS